MLSFVFWEIWIFEIFWPLYNLRHIICLLGTDVRISMEFKWVPTCFVSSEVLSSYPLLPSTILWSGIHTSPNFVTAEWIHNVAEAFLGTNLNFLLYIILTFYPMMILDHWFPTKFGVMLLTQVWEQMQRPWGSSIKDVGIFLAIFDTLLLL